MFALYIVRELPNRPDKIPERCKANKQLSERRHKVVYPIIHEEKSKLIKKTKENAKVIPIGVYGKLRSIQLVVA